VQEGTSQHANDPVSESLTASRLELMVACARASLAPGRCSGSAIGFGVFRVVIRICPEAQHAPESARTSFG